jgi:hypothetical protein
MKPRYSVLLVILTAAIIFLSACSSQASTASPGATSSVDGATLVQERCTKCHPLTRVVNSRYTAAQWKTIVDTMISKGAQVTPEEEPVIVDYLAANYGK